MLDQDSGTVLGLNLVDQQYVLQSEASKIPARGIETNAVSLET